MPLYHCALSIATLEPLAPEQAPREYGPDQKLVCMQHCTRTRYQQSCQAHLVMHERRPGDTRTDPAALSAEKARAVTEV